LRALGVDFGSKRIGIAVGESELGVAGARAALPASGTLARDAEAIADLARGEEAVLVVVGVPENPDGDDRMARVCLQLVERLRRLGLAVDTVDESLTSVEADGVMAASGLTAAERRRRRDGESACRILERYWSEHGAT
jgi:putative Holliday junction resolvase